jgi:hypothetical protein
MLFRDFEDYWKPFPGKQGSAPTYLAGLDETMRNRIRDELKARLPTQPGGAITLGARAWAVQGTVP